MSRRVILTTPYWSLNGVNAFSSDLAEGLQEKGYSVTLLLTDPGAYQRVPMPPPEGVSLELLSADARLSIKQRREALRAYLERRAPCIYLPNYDYNTSCIAPQLSPKIKAVGIVHSDDPEHYEHVRRLGKSWDAVVSVTDVIRRKVNEKNPDIRNRSIRIPYGVQATLERNKSTRGEGPLRIIYAGRMAQYQKKVFDLPAIAQRLAERGVFCEWTLAGDGIDREKLEKKFKTIQGRGGEVRFLGTINRKDLRRLFQQQDLFLLTSSFEGLPIALLEAMSEGCIPVAARTESGATELVRSGENGYLINTGDIEGYAEKIEALFHAAAERDRMSAAAQKTVEQNYSREKMIGAYIKLFEDLDLAEGCPRRFSGTVLPPPLWPSDWSRIPSLCKIAWQHLQKRVHKKFLPLKPQNTRQK